MRAWQKQLLYERLERAIADMYHNARMRMPTNLSDEEWEDYWNWFQWEGESEICYLNEGGSHSLGNGQLPAYSKTESLRRMYLGKSDTWYVRKSLLLRQQAGREVMRYAPYEMIGLYGRLYVWGRSGATVAPDYLVGATGGSGFRLRTDIVEDAEWCVEDVSQAIQIIESFNDYVRSWNEEAPRRWAQEKLEQSLIEEAQEIEQFARLYGGAR